MEEMRDKIPEYGTWEWRAYQYQRRLEEQRGHNYRYFNQKSWDKMEKEGWKIHDFNTKYARYGISSETAAKEAVEHYRSQGHHSHILCGYVKTKQHIKHYTVVYKESNEKEG